MFKQNIILECKIITCKCKLMQLEVMEEGDGEEEEEQRHRWDEMRWLWILWRWVCLFRTTWSCGWLRFKISIKIFNILQSSSTHYLSNLRSLRHPFFLFSFTSLSFVFILNTLMNPLIYLASISTQSIPSLLCIYILWKFYLNQINFLQLNYNWLD